MIKVLNFSKFTRLQYPHNIIHRLQQTHRKLLYISNPFIPQTMSIIDITILRPHLLAVSTNGNLLSWSLPSLQSQTTLQSASNFHSHLNLPSVHSSFLFAEFSSKITQFLPIFMKKVGNFLWIITQGEIIWLETKQIESYLRKNKYRSVAHPNTNPEQLNFKRYPQKSPITACIPIVQSTNTISQQFSQSENENQMKNEQDQEKYKERLPYQLIYARKDGTLVGFSGRDKGKGNVSGEEIMNINFSRNMEKEKEADRKKGIQEMEDDGIGKEYVLSIQSQYICDMFAYRDNSLVIAGTSAGRVLVINITFGRVVQDLTKTNTFKLSPIKKLIPNPIQPTKFFTLHENYLTQWGHLKPLGYYQYSAWSALWASSLSPSFSPSLTPSLTSSLTPSPSLSPKLLLNNGTKWLQIYNPVQNTKISQIQSNLQWITAIREIDGVVYLGGRGDIVEEVGGWVMIG